MHLLFMTTTAATVKDAARNVGKDAITMTEIIGAVAEGIMVTEITTTDINS